MATFRSFMQDQELSENTITAYETAVSLFFRRFDQFNKQNVIAYKRLMIEQYAPATANLRLNAIGKYAAYVSKPECAAKGIRIQRRMNLETVITEDEFVRLSRHLAQDNEMVYWLVQFLAKTGARVSEIVRLRKEGLVTGYQDMFSKGKVRRVYIPKPLIEDSAAYFQAHDNSYLFVTRRGNPICRRWALRLLTRCSQYGIRPEVLHPHSFRHFFAKQFLNQTSNLAMLAEVLGHSTVNTTAIYLQSSAAEKRATIDAAVNW